MAFTSILLVNNIHCPSCVSYAQDVLRDIPAIQSLRVSLIEQTISVKHADIKTRDLIVRALVQAAFEVHHVTTLDSAGKTVGDSGVTAKSKSSPTFGSGYFMSKVQRRHMKNCESCQRSRSQTIMKSKAKVALEAAWRSWRLNSTSKDDTSLFRANLQDEKPTVINMDGASDGAEIDTPTEHHEVYKTAISIEGMTCGSCVGTISGGLQQLPFVRSANIDLVGNNGTIVFEGKENIKSILEKIDDLGYDGIETKTERVFDHQRFRSAERAVRIQIEGMFCDHCPANIRTVIDLYKQRHSDEISITKWPTLVDPIIGIRYNPSPPKFTMRTLINLISSTHEAFNASVFHPPTLEERSHRMQRKEQKFILRRLAFTAVVAIPSFIIGVVFMSLVPSSNTTRRWFEEPIFGGNGMRMDWALFFLTTPVMFYGTDLFHRRAMKEILFIWKPKSKIPVLRRFYRFGSMNLLVSAGTCVAYFASLAVLILDATSDPSSMYDERSSTSYFDTVTFLTFFILIGRFLEAYSKAKTGDAVAMLSKLRPSEALLVDHGSPTGEKEMSDQVIHRSIPLDQLEVGDLVRIPHGTSPPTDGIIQEDGSFLFDESSLTGESKPVKKRLGDEVLAGSVNISDPVIIKVTEIEGTSMLDRIVNVVREGQAKRAPIERVADLITGYFVPVITLLALLTWIIWLALGEAGALPDTWLDVNQGGWPFWSLRFAIAVFVVACPCGIGLAAPTALFVGGGLAAKQGILVQGGGEAFQDASTLKAIVFDKTGTLTEGQMKVTDFEILKQHGQDQIIEAALLAMAHAMENSSSHPIAKAISEFCVQKGLESEFETSELKEIPGCGMTGHFNFRRIAPESQYEAVIGNERLLQTAREACSEQYQTRSLLTSKAEPSSDSTMTDEYFLVQSLRKYQSLGQSTAILAIKKLPDGSKRTMAAEHALVPVAVFAISDPLRAEASSVLRSLRNSGLEVHMCTGDNRTTAMTIAAQLDIPAKNVRAGVLPQDKAAYIRDLQGLSSDQPSEGPQKRNIVGFVGDGTNDTPALAAADVSIALASGSDVAMTTASFILLNSDLNTILTLVRLAKRVFLRVKLNFAWAAVYNVCLIPVAAGVFFPIGANESHGGWRLGPVWASAAMALSSVSVVLSSLALRLPELRL